ncbi:MAG: hypothetical protein IPI35_35460 [Deltaproteobacteria bacterium]|nr:hypothetical protein [Deltaproteobacteria bacterium]
MSTVDAEELADDLQTWVEGLDELADQLNRWRELAEQLPPAERDAELAKRAPMVDTWREFSAGFWPFVVVEPVQGQQGPKQVLEGIGLAPVVLVAAFGSLAISMVAAAYAVGRLTDLGEALASAYTTVTELEARVLAMQSGLTLQPSTLPPPPPDEGAGSGVMVFGGLLVLGLLGGAAWAFTRSR